MRNPDQQQLLSSVGHQVGQVSVRAHGRLQLKEHPGFPDPTPEMPPFARASSTPFSARTVALFSWSFLLVFFIVLADIARPAPATANHPSMPWGPIESAEIADRQSLPTALAW